MAAFVLLLLLCPAALSLETNDILKELSWETRLMLLKEFPFDQKEHIKPSQTPRSLPRRLNSAADDFPRRQVGLESLRLGLRTDPTQEDDVDEYYMKYKVYRLIYEAAKESDLKVKQAEVIAEQYKESKEFEVGFLFGDITQKFKLMTDTLATINRFRNHWESSEHINAYEQLANQAVVIRQLIDLVRLASKDDDDKRKSFVRNTDASSRFSSDESDDDDKTQRVTVVS